MNYLNSHSSSKIDILNVRVSLEAVIFHKINKTVLFGHLIRNTHTCAAELRLKANQGLIFHLIFRMALFSLWVAVFNAVTCVVSRTSI